MSALRCESCEAVTSVTWSGRCQACYRREFNAPVPMDHLLGAIPDIPEQQEPNGAVNGMIGALVPIPVTRHNLARQARTIRRLFTAYFLAKAKLRWLQRHFDAAAPEHNLPALLDLYFDRQHAAEVELSHCLEERGIDMENARREERARIVAALRKSVGNVVRDDDDQHMRVLWSAADAIERGEL